MYVWITFIPPKKRKTVSGKKITVKIVYIGATEIIAVIILKFEQGGYVHSGETHDHSTSLPLLNDGRHYG